MPAGHRKLNEDVLGAVCGYLSQGLPISTVCRIVQISRGAFYQWKERGKEAMRKKHADSTEGGVPPEEEIYYEFHRQTELALGQAERDLAEVVTQHAENGNLEAAQWLLVRRFTDNWARDVSVNISEDGDGLDELENDVLDEIEADDELREQVGEALDRAILGASDGDAEFDEDGMLEAAGLDGVDESDGDEDGGES